ncbi:MAG: sporulation protein YqfD [Bacillota bacterium]
MKRLLDYLLGYLIIYLKGEGIERFINLTLQRGINIWDISWLNESTVQAKVRISAIKPLRHISRISGCRFRIKSRIGFPFIIKFFSQRKMLALGAGLFIVLLYFFSSFVLFVEVTSPEPLRTIEAQMIKKLAAEKGITAGRPKWFMDFKQAEKYIMNSVPQLTWVGINTKGTRVEIRIVEKILPEPEEKNKKPGNIIASKDGVIAEILVMKGQALVKPGDTVSRGQVLISGIILPESEPGADQDNDLDQPDVLEKVKADGIVRARVWYYGYGQCPEIETGKRSTGRSAFSVALHWNNRRVNIWGPKKSPYKYFISQTEKRKIVSWRNITVPVEKVITRYRELELIKKEWGSKGAWTEACKNALQEAKRKMPPNAKILNQELKPVETRIPGLKKASAIIETEEDIGAFLSIE